jgi:ribose transport system substrate-binding protein
LKYFRDGKQIDLLLGSPVSESGLSNPERSFHLLPFKKEEKEMSKKFILKKQWTITSLLVVLMLLLGACTGGAATPAATEAPKATAAPTEKPTAVPPTEAPTSEPTAVPPTEAPTAEPTAAAPAEYKAVIRPAKQAWRIGYGNGWAADPFSAAVTKNIYDVAKQMGVEIIECDNAYDAEKTLQCADLLVSQKVDGIIFANWHADIAEAVSEKWINAGIPAVTYDGPHPGAIDFGADNYTAGKVGGEYLGNYIKDQGWAPEGVQVLLVTDPDVGEEPNKRVSGCLDGIKSVVQINDDQVSELIGGVDAASVFTTVTDWLTAHPDAANVVGCTVDDPRATGMSGALEAAGYLGKAAVVGQGVTTEAITELRRPADESVFIGSVAYSPEVYGNYLVPIIVDLIEGNPVPPRVVLQHFIIDRANLDQWYPEQ